MGCAFGDDGTLYVAEAFAGTLTAFKKGTRTTLVEGEPGTGTAGGDVAGHGKVVYSQTLPPEVGGSALTTLSRVQPSGKTKTLTSLLAFETENNPDEVNTCGALDPSPEWAAQAETAVDAIGPLSNPGLVDSHPHAVTGEPPLGTDPAVAPPHPEELFAVGPHGVPRIRGDDDRPSGDGHRVEVFMPVVPAAGLAHRRRPPPTQLSDCQGSPVNIASAVGTASIRASR